MKQFAQFFTYNKRIKSKFLAFFFIFLGILFVIYINNITTCFCGNVSPAISKIVIAMLTEITVFGKYHKKTTLTKILQKKKKKTEKKMNFLLDN